MKGLEGLVEESLEEQTGLYYEVTQPCPALSSPSLIWSCLPHRTVPLLSPVRTPRAPPTHSNCGNLQRGLWAQLEKVFNSHFYIVRECHRYVMCSLGPGWWVLWSQDGGDSHCPTFSIIFYFSPSLSRLLFSERVIINTNQVRN